MPTSPGARAVRSLDTLHALTYFAPEANEVYESVGLRPGGMTYFASRSAPMGAVAPGVTAATFYNFNPDLVARYLPRAWTLATPEDVLRARLVLADRALRRVLGEDVVDAPEVHEALDLARAATVDLPVAGRPLYAAHAALDWPAEPHVALWHAITVLREFRGDGHIAALVTAGLGGLDALVLHVGTRTSFTEPAARASRGWSDDLWEASRQGLADRGLVDADGAITEAGRALRREIESVTDRADEQPWQTLGAERTARLTELGAGLSARARDGGAFPPGVFYGA